MKLYSGLFIFSAALSDEGMDAAMASVKEDVDRIGGEIVKADVLGKRVFARPLKKASDGIYVRYSVRLDPGTVDTLNARLTLNANVFRAQLLRDDGTPPKAEEPEQPEAEPEAAPEAAPVATEEPVAAVEVKGDGEL